LLKPSPGTTGPQLDMRQDPQTQRTQVPLTLQQAVMRAIANNLDVRIVSFDPAIARQEILQAAAAFDYVVFADYLYKKDDMQTSGPYGGGEVEKASYDLGIKNKTITGAEWSLAWQMSRTAENSFFVGLPKRYEPQLTLQLAQPLLRNAWPVYNLARLDIARLNEKVQMEMFRQNVEQVVSEVVSLYWTLIQSRRDLEIQQQLLDATEQTLHRIQARAELDATSVQINQIKSAYESRRALLLRAQKLVMDVQQQLTKRMADAQLDLLGDYEVIPGTPLVDIPVQVDPTDRLLTALRYNPVLEQARLAIEVADIEVKVAVNQTLPRLDLTASAGLHGLDGRPGQATDNLLTGDYASYSAGLQFEYPLGNRERLAGLRGRRFQRLKTITTLQNIADRLAVDLLERVRQVDASYREMLAQQLAVQAARDQLKAMEDIERIRARLTPEFLQVKLSAQESLANAERSQVRALVEYNIALADLDRVTGTILQTYQVELSDSMISPAAAIHSDGSIQSAVQPNKVDDQLIHP